MDQTVAMAEVNIKNTLVLFFLAQIAVQTSHAGWICEDHTTAQKVNETVEGPCGRMNLKFAFGGNFIGVDFYKAIFISSPLYQFQIVNSKLNEVKMNFMYLSRGKIESTQFKNAQIKGTKFLSVKFKNVDFSGANLSGTQFINCQFEDVLFNDAILTSTLFQFSDFKNSPLSNSSEYFISGTTSK